MTAKWGELVVKIVGMESEDQPGWVSCEFVDAGNAVVKIVEKVPVVTSKSIESPTAFPMRGTIRCEILAEWTDPSGRKLAKIDTERPWNIRSVDGASEFVVETNQIVVET
jgi:hypothetical protein